MQQIILGKTCTSKDLSWNNDTTGNVLGLKIFNTENRYLMKNSSEMHAIFDKFTGCLKLLAFFFSTTDIKMRSGIECLPLLYSYWTTQCSQLKADNMRYSVIFYSLHVLQEISQWHTWIIIIIYILHVLNWI